MEKGILIKNLDLTKYKYPYMAQRSYGKNRWLVEAYQTEHDHSFRGFVGQVTVCNASGDLLSKKTRDNFLNIFDAFPWADNQVDHKHEVFKEVYVNMLMKGEKWSTTE